MTSFLNEVVLAFTGSGPGGVSSATSALVMMLLSLFVGGILGIGASLVASIILSWWQNRKFKPIEGWYTGYAFKNSSSSLLDFEQPSSVAYIKREKDNIFDITVFENKNDSYWKGYIAMDTVKFGSLVCNYERLHGREPTHEHLFTFKRCVIINGPDKNGRQRPFFCLEGNDQLKYGREALEKFEGRADQTDPQVLSQEWRSRQTSR